MVVVNGQNLFFDAHFFQFLQRNSSCAEVELGIGVGVLDGATDIK